MSPRYSATVNAIGWFDFDADDDEDAADVAEQLISPPAIDPHSFSLGLATDDRS